jgi:hypothetical protein
MRTNGPQTAGVGLTQGPPDLRIELNGRLTDPRREFCGTQSQ